jgi:hypothetical protein
MNPVPTSAKRVVVFSFLFHFPFFYIQNFYKSFFSLDKVLVQAFTVYFTLVNKFGKIFLTYKEICKGAGAKSNMRKGFLILEEMREYLVIYKESVSHITYMSMTLIPLPSKFSFLFLAVNV